MSNPHIRMSVIREALEMKLAHACSSKGFYDAQARKISPIRRKEVFERDNGLCLSCGKTGTEIDHIDGDQDDIDNLQLLCNRCHIRKTQARFQLLTPEHPRYAEVKARRESLESRIYAAEPERPCYEPVTWEVVEKQLMSEQRQLLRTIKEDIEGKAENRDPFVEELVINELNELDELRNRLKSLEMEKQAEIDQILTPEVLAQVKEIRTRYSEEAKDLIKSESTLENQVKKRVLEYGLKVKGKNLQAVISKSSPNWDTKALEEYAKTHPEILQFRAEGKTFTSVRQVGKEKD